MYKIIDGYIIKQISKNFFSCQLGMGLLFWLYSITIFLGTSNADLVTLSDCLKCIIVKNDYFTRNFDSTFFIFFNRHIIWSLQPNK